MDYYSTQITGLIEQLSRLPGIGSKSAQRLAFHIINMPVEQAEKLSQAIVDARKNVRYCRECQTLTDNDICPICANPKRDHDTIMVVETTRDLAAYEKTGKYEGVYHVLHGAISPMLGIGPNDIRLKELMTRLGKESVREVIKAVLPDAEERISYGMPTFRRRHNLIHFAAMKHHLGIYHTDTGECMEYHGA